MKNASHVTRPMAVGAFLIGLLLTAVAVVWHARSNAALVEERFAAAAVKVTASIGTRMELYEYGLRGARGAVISAGPASIDPERYAQYANTRDLPREFPGAHGIGFIRRVPATNVARYVSTQRRQGRPDFAIRQLAPSDGERFVIELIEPLDANRAAIGLDIASEANRRRAALAAMRSGKATLTGPITLVQASSKPQRSFLLLLPVYRPGADIGSVAAREAAAEGWAYAPLIIDEVLSGIDLRDGQIGLSLRDETDGPSATPFFASSVAADPGVAARVETLEVFGRRWVAEVRPTVQFEQGLGLIDPRWTTLLGAVLSTVLAAWAAAIDRSRRSDAQRRLSEAHRAAMVTASEDAIVSLSLDGHITSWNPAAQRLFGLAADEALGQPLDLLLPPDQQADPQGHVLARVAKGEVVAPFETVRRRRNGQLLEVSISAVPLLAEGRVVGVAKTYRDISARKAAERQLRQSYAELEARVAERTALVEASRRDLRQVLDALPPLVGAWTKQLTNRFANAAYASYFGKSPEEIANMTLPELLGPELYARNASFVRRALAGEEIQFERDLPLANGQGLRHTLAHYLPYRENGEVAGFFVLVHDVTDLKQSERRASAATRKADALLDMVQQHAIFSITDGDGRIQDVNDAFCEITGSTREELIGLSHRQVLQATQGEAFWRDVWGSVTAGASWRGEICNLAKDGSTHWVDGIITPFVGETGKIENYVAVCFDITQRKAAEAALAARERIMRLVFDAYPGVLAYWDRDMRCVFANRAYDEWLGMQPDSMIGRTQRELLDEATFTSNEPLMLAVLRGEARTVERHRVTASGRAVDYLLHYVPDVVGADVQGFISATVDITERKRAEEEANRMSAQLRAVLDAATEVAIIAVDTDGAIALFNSGAERLLGYRREEVLGQESLASFHDVEELRLQARALGEDTGRKVRTDRVLFDDDALGVAQTWSYRRKDGSNVQVSLTVTAMLDAEGRSIGHLAVAHDVSRQKEYERSLQEAAQAAQRANLAKSQFLANMSHEIRTPLSALIGVGYLLAGTPLDADQRQLLAKSQMAGRSLMGIVNDVLDLAKIEAGELTLEHAPFPPREILAEVDAMFRAQTDEKRLVYELHCDAAVPQQLVGDALRVRQILVNLIGNAVKFTSHGSIRVRLELLSLGATVARLRCSVTDTGAGVAKDAQAHLFQAFSQADASTTRRFGGTGLGLSIVRQMAQTMGGDVGMRSEVGQGSEFWAVLSLALPDNEVLTEVARGCETLDVWIVGEPTDDRHALVALARSLGWRASELDSEAALLAQIETRLVAAAALPDALIVSQRLSRNASTPLAGRVQQRLGQAQMPALLLFDDRDPSDGGVSSGAPHGDRALRKPVGTSDLFNAVNDAVAASTGSTAKVLQSTRVGSLDARWLAGVRVLVVDDSDVNRDVAQRLLEREAAEVLTCNDGHEALAALRAQPDGFDVVLMDVQMTGMDGLEATRRLRDELGLSLPVVALTAGALVEERRRALDAGMTDFLTKPLDPQTLVRTLRQVVEARKGAPLLVRRMPAQAVAAVPWPAVAGIDEAEAALRTAGDPVLWQSLMASLVREFGDLVAPDVALPANQEGRTALAARLHKLRGCSGTVGAREVHRLTQRAQDALAASSDNAAAVINELAQALRVLFDAAAPMLAQREQALREAAKAAEAAQDVTPITQAELGALLDHLRLQSMSALDAFEALAPRLGRVHGSERVLQVRQTLDALDFSRALALLEEAG